MLFKYLSFIFFCVIGLVAAADRGNYIVPGLVKLVHASYLSLSNANNGAVLNKNLKANIKSRQEPQKFYGTDKWFAGHRNGQSGLNNPYTQDVTNYKNGGNWIHDQVAKEKKYLTDDTRFWIYVVAI